MTKMSNRMNKSGLLLAVIVAVCLQTQVFAADKKCQGAFDIYFVLDKSSSLLKAEKNHFKEETVSFVTLLSEKFVSPLSRLSYITFSTTADIIMPLTSDRQIMAKKLDELKSTIPHGPTLLHLGLKKVNDQITTQRDQRASIIIVLSDGKLDYPTKVKSVVEADRARKYGSTLYVIGVSNFDRYQLLAIAGGKSRCVFQVKDFSQLDNIIKEILLASCIEVLSVDPEYVCHNESFQVGVYGRGFNITGDASSVRCNFWTERRPESVAIPITTQDGYLLCQTPDGFKLEEQETCTMLVSVNGGVSFISSNVTVTGAYCNASGGTWVALLIFLAVLAFALWWISDLCCSRQKKKPADAQPVKSEPVAPDEVPQNVQMWPSVDASRYGAGGVGGIKPMEVRWGDKGCTEGAMHLERASDAREIQVMRRKPSEKPAPQPEPSKPGCLEKVFGIACLVSLYKAISSKRPTRDEMSRCIFIKQSGAKEAVEKSSKGYLDTSE